MYIKCDFEVCNLFNLEMKYSQLIRKCIDLIDTYNENIMTPDSHAQEFIAHLKL